MEQCENKTVFSGIFQLTSKNQEKNYRRRVSKVI